MAGADQAPLATIDPTSGDTIFATAFWNLPVSTNENVGTPISSSLLSLRCEQNPATSNITLIADGKGAAKLDVCDVLGRPMFSTDVMLLQGSPLHFEIPIKLMAGTYYARIVDSSGTAREVSIVEVY